MKTFTKKGEIINELESCFSKFEENDITPFINELRTRLLSSKIKFPLLEYCGEEIHSRTPKNYHIPICDQIAKLKTIGGDVIIGILLRNHLEDDLSLIFHKAASYISYTGTWYSTDTIGERVFGWALLNHFEEARKELEKLAESENKWIVRSIGPGCHYAVKKGLSPDKAENLFVFLFSLSDAKDHHIKTGIGWAAKTIAKFHPKIIHKYTHDLESEKVGQWFRTKIRIGLDRNSYAKGN